MFWLNIYIYIYIYIYIDTVRLIRKKKKKEQKLWSKHEADLPRKKTVVYRLNIVYF